MFAFDSEFYVSVIAELTRERPLLPLAKPQRNSPMYDNLEPLTPALLFPERQVRDPDMGWACLAGLWLAHGFLDESHKISQEIDTPTGSYWHGIMHRLEPDFDNSKYWFRRVGQHPIFEALRTDAAAIADGSAIGSLQTQSAWDPFAFVDLCRDSVERGSQAEPICLAAQRREWELLFDFCYGAAIGDRIQPP